MSNKTQILVAIDDSAASENAVRYLAPLAAGADGYRVRLFYIVEPIGPLWEPMHGDLNTKSDAPAGDPEAHQIDEANKRARPILEKMAAVLTDAGVDSDRIEQTWFISSREDTLVAEVRRLVESEGYGTVVVGRTSLPWYRELFHQHLGTQLVNKGEGLAVWVVG